MTATVLILSALVAIGTALPWSRSPRWWVRAWEFPRLHIAIVAVLCALTLPVTQAPFAAALSLLMLACAAYQAVRIFPYTPFAHPEVPYVRDVPSERQIKLIAANVLRDNTQTQALMDIVEAQDPDVLFLMETDQRWTDALAPLLARYPTVLTYPLDNFYGLIFATRLTAPSAEVIFLSEDNTPSIAARLLGPDGTPFEFLGLHPRPPVPGNDTVLRDYQIKRAADMATQTPPPTICMGDFNDVAWSWTTRRFKRRGGFLEPRVGRGMFPTWHAQYPILGVPIDQLYMTNDVGLVDFGLLGNFGSDHLPISATITLPT